MRHLILPAMILAGVSGAAQARGQDYPSCRIAEQRAVSGETGGRIRDPRQAHVSMRANILQADIGSARKARRLSQRDADRLWQRVEAVRRGSDRLTTAQSFLSAAERASYDRALDAVALRLCR